MLSCKTRNRPSGAFGSALRRLRLPLTILAALFPLSACSVQDRVVIVPVAPPPVADALLAPVKPHACNLRPADAYPPPDLEAERRCLEAAANAARQRHASLASAVRVREKAAAEAVSAAR